MFVKEPRSKRPSRHLRTRVESCVDTVLRMDKCLGQGKIRPDVIERFEQLKDLLDRVADETVEEHYVAQIEEATNQLLMEIRRSLGEERFAGFCEGRTH
jgi:hypothetical protein